MQAMSLPEQLDQIVRLMQGAPKQIKVEALLDYGRRIPPLPDHLDAGDLEQVHECQSPFFLATELDGDGKVRLFFDSPPEAPTVRGFAGILVAGLDGEEPGTILAVDDEFFYDMGLEEVVTPQRLRGMAAILARIKRQVRELS